MYLYIYIYTCNHIHIYIYICIPMCVYISSKHTIIDLYCMYWPDDHHSDYVPLEKTQEAYLHHSV